jgi:hypothetical protein
MKSKSVVFLAVLFISITLIYLVLCKTGINITIENFESRSSSKSDIAFKLGIPESRIRNYKESGDINNTNEFKITFDIYPRTVSDSNSSLITEVENKIKKMINNKDIITINTSNGIKVYIGNIKYNTQDMSLIGDSSEKEKNNKTTKDKFVNPAIDPQINYMNYLKTGIHKEISIEPRYKFDKMGELVLEPIPTPSKPSTTPTPPRPSRR